MFGGIVNMLLQMLSVCLKEHAIYIVQVLMKWGFRI